MAIDYETSLLQVSLLFTPALITAVDQTVVCHAPMIRRLPSPQWNQ